MGRIEDLADRYERHISAPWVHNLAGAQKVIFVVYDMTDERRLRTKKQLFEQATRGSKHGWREFDFTDVFPTWMAADEYSEAYFESPKDLTKVSRKNEHAEFTVHAADCLRKVLSGDGVDDDTVVGVFGAGTLYGFARVSHILKKVEGDIRGRLVLFFPGSYEQNTYRLLEAPDVSSYLAVPITLHDGGLDQ